MASSKRRESLFLTPVTPDEARRRAFRISHPQNGALVNVPPYDTFHLAFEQEQPGSSATISSYCVEADRDGKCFRINELSFDIETVLPGTHVFELRDWLSREVVDSVVVDFYERQGCTRGYEAMTGLSPPLPETASLISQFPRFVRELGRRGRPLGESEVAGVM